MPPRPGAGVFWALAGTCVGRGSWVTPFRDRAPTWAPVRNWKMSSAPTRESPDKLGPLCQYESMVTKGLLQHDAQQQKVAQMLDYLLGQLKEYQHEMEAYQVKLANWARARQHQRNTILKEQAQTEAQKRLQRISQENRIGVFGWWFRKTGNVKAEPGAGRMVARIKLEKQLDSLVGPRPPPPPSPQGLYLYGNVGCGKTFLMDMFFRASDGIVSHRRRMHFHAAMLEVHDRMHKLWKQRRQKVEEIERERSESIVVSESGVMTLERAAREWLEEEEHWGRDHESDLSVLYSVADDLFGHMNGGGGASLLCFDELQVVDVFTALALSSILNRLLSRGAVIVATSNRAPQDLNKDGLQKQIFGAFVRNLEQHCHSILVGVDKDYRRIAAASSKKDKQLHYFWPLGEQSQHKLDLLWNQLVQTCNSTSIPVMFGRGLEVSQSSGGVARFAFQGLCNRPLGAADYVSIAQNYHTIFITEIPVMSMKNSDQARRFITLVDELYNHHCRLICTAAAPVDDLFLGTDEGALVDLESLQFETEGEGSRLRKDVLVSGSVAPLATTKEEKVSIEALLSGREELFAFRRAVSRMIEMESPIYLQALSCHPKYTNTTGGEKDRV